MRAVIFDLDGTLADTLLDIGRSANHALARQGFATLPEASYGALVGDGARKLIERAAPGADDTQWDTLLALFRAHYLEHLLDSTRSYPGIDAVVDALAARGLELAVLSNKPDQATSVMVRGLFPDAPFSIVWGEREGVPKKPDPTAALEIARRFGLEPGECVFVGDTAVDVETARRAGMVAIAVLWGFRGRAELAPLRPTALLERPEQLLDVLDRLASAAEDG